MLVTRYKGVPIYFGDGEYYLWVDGDKWHFPTEREIMEFIDEELGL